MKPKNTICLLVANELNCECQPKLPTCHHEFLQSSTYFSTDPFVMVIIFVLASRFRLANPNPQQSQMTNLQPSITPNPKLFLMQELLETRILNK